MTSDADRARWNDRFATDEYIFGTEPSDLLPTQTAHLVAGRSALVVADGEGRNGVFLAEQGLEVTSFDLSPNGIAKAKRLASSRGVRLAIREGDAASWNWTAAAYDVVVGVFFQFAGPDLRTRIFHGMAAALKPGGVVLLRGYTPKQLEHRTGGPAVLENLYTPQILRDGFPGFEMLMLEEQERELSEGSRHAGMSAFIDMVARKPAG